MPSPISKCQTAVSPFLHQHFASFKVAQHKSQATSYHQVLLLPSHRAKSQSEHSKQIHVLLILITLADLWSVQS